MWNRAGWKRSLFVATIAIIAGAALFVTATPSTGESTLGGVPLSISVVPDTLYRGDAPLVLVQSDATGQNYTITYEITSVNNDRRVVLVSPPRGMLVEKIWEQFHLATSPDMPFPSTVKITVTAANGTKVVTDPPLTIQTTP